ncbi:uncharacterized protein Dana_GF26986, isoform A [Drosophila ananassae]|uniref:Uncharacterized protein, isoform A n=1 Tax=Drosophila ananassae TaxID=7217 RepID=A0A0P9ASA1_DROAN|nr:uncharacterized protein Dana_GF26986, isoform A [Drosophila ananassae]
MLYLYERKPKCSDSLGCYDKLRKEWEEKSRNQENHDSENISNGNEIVQLTEGGAGVSKRQFQGNPGVENVEHLRDMQFPPRKIPKKEIVLPVEEMRPVRHDPPFRRGALGRPLTAREQREYWTKLYEHIAWSVKSGAFQLPPLKPNQCCKCRLHLTNLEQKTKHELLCKPELYHLGCPCGFLTNKMQSLAPHRANCSKSKNIKSMGVCGWIPFLSPSQRQWPIFDDPNRTNESHR